MPTIWPFPPRDGMVEGLEFSTDILRAFATEQRIRRTDIPRRRFSCSYAWTDRVYEVARALMFKTHPGPFEIPDWAMWQKISVEAGTSLIPVDTTAAKYVDRLIIMDRYDAYEAFDIVSVSASGVTIDGAVSRRFQNATVAPLIEAYAPEGLSAPRTVQPFVEADVEWINFIGPDLVESGLVELGQRTIAVITTTKDEGVSVNSIVNFDAEQIDELNAWAIGDSGRLNVQAGIDTVQLIYAVGGVSGTGSSKILAQIVADGTEPTPGVIEGRENYLYTEKGYIGYRIIGFDFAGRVAMSPMLPVSAGDWFVALTPGFAADLAGQEQAIRTSFMMWKLPPTQKRALVKATANQVADQNTNDAPLQFSEVVYDTLGFWDASAPNEFIVPDGVTVISALVNVQEQTVSSSCHGVEIRVNGERKAGSLTYPNEHYNACTGPVSVLPGDRVTFHGLSYFQYRTEVGFPPAVARTYIAAGTSAYIEQTIGRSAALTLGTRVINPADGGFFTLTWGNVEHDGLEYWDAETPDRLTVTVAGWHQVGACLFATTGYVNDTAAIRIDRYSSDGTFIERFEERALNTPDKFIFNDNYLCNVNVQSQHMLCAVGDYFIAYARADGAPVYGTSVESDTRFWIQDFKGISTSDGSTALGEYLGRPLLNHCAKLGDGSFAENLKHPHNAIDNGIALPFFDTNVETNRQIFGSAWQTARGFESFDLRKAFYELRGRQTSFWAPLWSRGLRPTGTIDSAATSITIYHVGYAAAYGSGHIFIRDGGGTVYAREVLSSVDNGNGTETLTISAALGVTLTVGAVKMFARLLFCRILADRIEIRHPAGVGPKIVLPLEEVPFFTDDYLSPSIPPESDLVSDDAASDDFVSAETASDSEFNESDAASDADILSDEIAEGESDLDVGSDAIASEFEDESEEIDDILSDDQFSDDQLSDDPASDDMASDDAASDDRASDDAVSDDAASDDLASDTGSVSRARFNLPTGYTNAENGVTLEWSTAVYNDAGVTVDGGDDSRIVIPADGYYQIYAQAVWTVNSGLALADGVRIEIRIGGTTTYPGIGANGSTGAFTGITPFCRSTQTPLLFLTAGQYFQVFTDFSGLPSANVVTASGTARTHFTVRRVSSVVGALTYLTSDEAGTSDTTFNWDAESYDSGSIWTSGATHVAPSGPTKVSACASWSTSGLAVDWGHRVLINGSVAARCYRDSNSTYPSAHFDSGPLAISATNTVAADITSADASFNHLANTTALATEFHSDDSIRLALTADLTTIDADTSPPYQVGWTSVTEDSIGLFSAGSPTRIPLPVGYAKAGAVLALSAFGVNDTCQVRIGHYNSSNTLIDLWLSDMIVTTQTNLLVPINTGEIVVSSGDYLVVGLEAQGDTSVSIIVGSYAWARAYS